MAASLQTLKDGYDAAAASGDWAGAVTYLTRAQGLIAMSPDAAAESFNMRWRGTEIASALDSARKELARVNGTRGLHRVNIKPVGVTNDAD